MAFEEGQDSEEDDENEAEFTVTNPFLNYGFIAYDCKGVDNYGTWIGKRRYREFVIMKEKIEQAWPGIPIPILPPKNIIEKIASRE